MSEARYELWDLPGPFPIPDGFYVKEAYFVIEANCIHVLLCPYAPAKVREPKQSSAKKASSFGPF